jgi:hypothetical protein
MIANEPPVNAVSFIWYVPVKSRIVPPQGSSVSASGMVATGQVKEPLHAAHPVGHGMPLGLTHTSCALEHATDANKTASNTTFSTSISPVVSANAEDYFAPTYRESNVIIEVTAPRVSRYLPLLYRRCDLFNQHMTALRNCHLPTIHLSSVVSCSTENCRAGPRRLIGLYAAYQEKESFSVHGCADKGNKEEQCCIYVA